MTEGIGNPNVQPPVTEVPLNGAGDAIEAGEPQEANASLFDTYVYETEDGEYFSAAQKSEKSDSVFGSFTGWANKHEQAMGDNKYSAMNPEDRLNTYYASIEALEIGDYFNILGDRDIGELDAAYQEIAESEIEAENKDKNADTLTFDEWLGDYEEVDDENK